MTPFLQATVVVLILLLAFQSWRHRSKIRRLTEALRSHDREALQSSPAGRSAGPIGELERQIFEQLFEAEKLEKRVDRRDTLLKAVLDGLDDAVLVFDGAPRIRFANASAQRLFAWDSPPIGKRASACISHSDLLEMINEVVKHGRPEQGEITLHPLKAASPVPLTLEVDIAPLMFGKKNTVSRARAVMHDVSQDRHLEQVRKDFVANASHELRTPLTVINGYLETLVEEGLGRPELAERVLPVMQKHGIRIARIVEDMLTISKLEGTEEALRMERFDLRSCAEEVADRLSTVADQRGARILLDFPDEGSEVDGDAFYWDQILFNLVDNAIKENEQPGLTVTISMRQGEDHAEVSVSDTGVGIPQAALPHIFKRFYRVDENRSADKKGTGLGLSIVKRAVEAHGGRIRVESQPGKRTAFIMTLPRNTSASARGRESAVHREPEGDQANGDEDQDAEHHQGGATVR